MEPNPAVNVRQNIKFYNHSKVRKKVLKPIKSANTDLKKSAKTTKKC